MISLAEAQARVLSACRPLPPEPVPVDEARGLVLAEAAVARTPVPPFPNTAMDGFAVRAADTAGAPVPLRVTGTLAAGADPGPFHVGAGEAVRIMTGAPIPPGADAIVMVERTRPAGAAETPEAGAAAEAVEAAGEQVVIEVAARPGDHVRPTGEDLAAGAEVFPAGVVLGPGHLGVLASAGIGEVVAHPRLRVAVLSTGDELVEPGQPLGPGQIHDANRRSLLGLVAEAGWTGLDLGVVPDDEGAIDAAISKAIAGAHAVLTSGGVSMGVYDHVKTVLDRRSGGAMSWMQVAIKPAKPLSFGLVEGVPVFGLPGNPVSAMVSFELFARPALQRLAGGGRPRPRVVAVADEPLARRPDGKTHFARVACRWDGAARCFRVTSSGGQASNLLRTMALADALAVLPDGDGIPAGGDVEVILLVDPFLTT